MVSLFLQSLLLLPKVFINKMALVARMKQHGLLLTKDDLAKATTVCSIYQQSKPKSTCMLTCFSRVWLFETSWTVASQVPLSLGFSRQEYGICCHALLQGFFPTQILNLHLLLLLFWQVGSLSLAWDDQPLGGSLTLLNHFHYKSLSVLFLAQKILTLNINFPSLWPNSLRMALHNSFLTIMVFHIALLLIEKLS